MPARRATAWMAAMVAGVVTVPPAALWSVLEANEPRRRPREVAAVADRLLDVGRRQEAALARDRPRHGASRTESPPPSNCRCAPSPRRSLSPPRQPCAINADRLAMVPDGTNSASSLPVVAQASRSSSATVGSSPRARCIAQPRRGDRRAHLRRGQGNGCRF